MANLYRLSMILAVVMFLVMAPMAFAQTGDTDTDQTDVTEDVENTEDDVDPTVDNTQMTQTGAATDTVVGEDDTDVDVDVDAQGTETGVDVDVQDTDAAVGDEADAGKLGEDPQAQTDQDVLLPETGGEASSWPVLLLLVAGAVFVATGLLSLSFSNRSR